MIYSSLSNGIFWGHMCRFRLVPSSQQSELLLELYRRYQIGNYLGGPEYRIKYLILLCREIKGDLLSSEDKSLLLSIRQKFKFISDIKTLNLCHLFWEITADPQYFNAILKLKSDPYSPLYPHVKMLLLHNDID